MNTFFLGLALSLLYGLFGAVIIVAIEGLVPMQAFLAAYTGSFKTLFSLGIILGTALIVGRGQHLVAQTVEKAFSPEQLATTEFHQYRQRFESRRRSSTFAGTFAVVGYAIFSSVGLPLSGIGWHLLVVAACAEYALGVYIGRKLFYAGMMLHSLAAAPIRRNLFRERELDDIDSYIHVASTLTVLFVYIHVVGYYNGPFRFDGVLGSGVRPLLLLPAVIATPVLLIFNFYPRAVLKKIYDASIDLEVGQLKRALKTEELSAFEKRTLIMEVDRMARDELRYRLQLTLSDLPIGLAVVVMILEPLLG